jgi:hypothetical protein
MPIRFLRKEGSIPRLTSVSRDNPLPVSVQNSDTIPTENVAIDTLLYSSNLNPTQATSAFPSNTDLFGNTDPNTATIVRAEAYRRFILTGWRSSTTTATSLTVDLYARSTDPNGQPLNSSGSGVWLLIGSFATAATTSAEFFRLVLEPTDGKPPGFDHYRICIRKSTDDTITVNLVLRGER